ncbi:hypothetical protein E2C01_022011 [Portunus trituberculatus]|uniref:Uncharacterized protein n=1 Tax=Portunus trituberculatus TaxID=210409 RepID=A0A5B7E4A6_PORTR|nr:hypothetical protein [Portunus trituberculatus]
MLLSTDSCYITAVRQERKWSSYTSNKQISKTRWPPLLSQMTSWCSRGDSSVLLDPVQEVVHAGEGIGIALLATSSGPKGGDTVGLAAVVEGTARVTLKHHQNLR